MSLDGVDFKIQEPHPFSPAYFSHKFKAAGLRYEIAISIHTGEIVWCHGGYPCGKYPDITVARMHLVGLLNENEKVIADRGYNDPCVFILPTEANKGRHKMIMSRHETVNKRIRHFNILQHTFRHDKSLHGKCFHAVLNLVALTIKHEEPLFSVN